MATYLEILGRSLAIPDPDVVDSLSGSYRVVCADLEDAKSRLGALASQGTGSEWTGRAASAFAQKIGSLPAQLDQASRSYATVAAALTGYAAALRPVVAALAALVNQSEEADGELRGVVAARQQIIGQGQDPLASGWDARLDEAVVRVRWAEDRLNALLGDLDELSGQCVRQIEQASREGIQNNLVTDLKVYIAPAAAMILATDVKAIRAVGAVADDLFVRPFTKLASDLANFDPARSFESLGTLCADLAGALGVLALFVPVLGEFVAPLLVVAAASDITALATHEQGASWGQLGSTALDLGLAGTGAILDRGATAGDELLRGAVQHDTISQIEGLADGTDARVSGAALESAGVRDYFTGDVFATSWHETGQRFDDPAQALQDARYSCLHFGALAGVHSPAVVTLEHIKFGLDRLGDAKTVAEAQYEKGHDQ